MGVSRLLQFPLQCWQLQFCSHFVFIAIQIPFPANPFFSHSSKSWGCHLCGLCAPTSVASVLSPFLVGPNCRLRDCCGMRENLLLRGPHACGFSQWWAPPPPPPPLRPSRSAR